MKRASSHVWLRCSVVASLPAAEPARVRVVSDKNGIEFTAGDALVTRYMIAEGIAKPYFWPLNAPGNVAVTRGWPMQKGLAEETTDHVHQKSAWFCHGDVIPEGLELKERSTDKRVKGVDFWSESRGHGKIVCVEVGDPKSRGQRRPAWSRERVAGRRTGPRSWTSAASSPSATSATPG